MQRRIQKCNCIIVVEETGHSQSPKCYGWLDKNQEFKERRYRKREKFPELTFVKYRKKSYKVLKNFLVRKKNVSTFSLYFNPSATNVLPKNLKSTILNCYLPSFANTMLDHYS